MQIFHENFVERVVIVLNSPKGHKVTQRPSVGSVMLGWAVKNQILITNLLSKLNFVLFFF